MQGLLPRIAAPAQPILLETVEVFNNFSYLISRNALMRVCNLNTVEME